MHCIFHHTKVSKLLGLSQFRQWWPCDVELSIFGENFRLVRICSIFDIYQILDNSILFLSVRVRLCFWWLLRRRWCPQRPIEYGKFLLQFWLFNHCYSWGSRLLDASRPSLPLPCVIVIMPDSKKNMGPGTPGSQNETLRYSLHITL